MVTVGWLSAAVEKICDFLVGMTVLPAGEYDKVTHQSVAV